jgi:aspartyl/asparaginyl-tRNA synthetase
MFEFESRGNLNDLEILEAALLEHLGYGRSTSFPRLNYEDAAWKYGTDDISSQVELKIAADYGRAVFLKNFPERTSPFWNMKRDGQGHACKIDVILDGMETIGSAERSCDPIAMRQAFYSISNGGYAQKLFDLFGRERVEAELEDFLKLKFVPRYGGGIGMTRLMRSQSMFASPTKVAVIA